METKTPIQPTDSEKGSSTTPTDRRSQRRLTIRTKISVILDDRPDPIEVENQNLSWSGALFIAADPTIGEQERLRLTFPWLEGQSFSTEADVMRCERLSDGRFAVAVRFYCVASADQKRLTKLLKLLAAEEDRAGSEAITPIAQTLDLTVTDDEEMRAHLRHIATGRLSLTVLGAYRLDQSLLLNLTGSQRYPKLHLRARVLAQEIIEIPFSSQQTLVKLELGFEHPEQDLQRLAALLEP